MRLLSAVLFIFILVLGWYHINVSSTQKKENLTLVTQLKSAEAELSLLHSSIAGYRMESGKYIAMVWDLGVDLHETELELIEIKSSLIFRQEEVRQLNSVRLYLEHRLTAVRAELIRERLHHKAQQGQCSKSPSIKDFYEHYMPQNTELASINE